MPILVHHLNNSRSQRVLWLLEELELDYQVVRYQRDPDTMLAPPELKKIHPLGKSPVVEDGDMKLAESGAIIDALAQKYGAGKLVPALDAPAFIDYRYWLHYAEGSAMSPLLLKLVFDKIESAPMPFFIKPVAKGISAKTKEAFISPQLKTHFDFMNATLGKQKWFAGEHFSAADIQMSFPIEAGEARVGYQHYPHLTDFLTRIHERPAYQAALEKGGPYTV